MTSTIEVETASRSVAHDGTKMPNKSGQILMQQRTTPKAAMLVMNNNSPNL
eukprot:CAMPEP_0201927280 /NCGR_PEP_ID=MMETSP0903-20130614/18352_1 /ASSEMBLY_ACC=CAM_ASM_000552 /TAXON_ID=420261 /ORGANISM="Thalassiosira antarctica, Strain CCMP982" /LENGTH=50 /DNA_ID=CAMNT_0048465423 /DNA_START=1 /DNA_END=150 /DNA_ORIENTATION=+